MKAKVKKPVAPNLEQLSRAKVPNSHLFVVTGAAGGILGAVTAVLVVGGTIGTVSAAFQLEHATDATIAQLLTSIGAAVGGIVTGLTAGWMGMIDDKAIEEHNFQSRIAGHVLPKAFKKASKKEYDKAQMQMIQAMQGIDYDPGHQMLPTDALGYLTIMPDDLLEALPAHIRLDTYRTQADLVLSKYAGLCAHECVEGRIIEERIMSSDWTMEQKAEEYRLMRNYVHGESDRKTLKVTPLPEKMRDRHVSDGYGFDDFMNDLGDSMSQPSSRSRNRSDNDGFVWWPTGGSSGGSSSSGSIGGPAGSVGSRTHGGFQTGGGFGGERMLTGGAMGEAMPMPIPSISAPTDGGDFLGGLMDSTGGGSGSRSSGSDDGKGAAALILIVIAVVVLAVAAKVTWDAVRINYFKRAPMPHLNGVDLPLMTRSLKSIKSEIDKMYGKTRKPGTAPQVA